MKARILEKLDCPKCTDFKLAPQGQAGACPELVCPSCGASYPNREGIPDFVGTAAAPRTFSSQWAMEFSPLVFLYERLWRPMVTAPFSSLSWEMELTSEYLSLSPGLELLDLACGPGNFTRRFSKPLAGGTLIGVDLSLPMLRRAERELRRVGADNITLVRADVSRWPFARSCFDRVHCAGGLHLFPALPDVFASIHRSLVKGGIFVGSTYCVAEGAVKGGIQKYVSAAHGFRWFRPDELRELAIDAGFEGWEHRMKKQGIVFRAVKR